MLKLANAIHRNEKGFTLVELMVVVVIIGVLVAIAIPIYNTIQAGATERACQANLRTLMGAAGIFRADQTPPAWPATAAALTPDYVRAIPVCPEDGTTAYEYAATTGVFTCPNGHTLP